MSLESRLAIPTIPQTPAEYGPKPTSEWDGTRGFIQTSGLETPPTDFTELLKFFQYDPNEVKIVGSLGQSRWQVITKRRETDEGYAEDPYETRWLTAYRFALAPAATSGMDELMALINRKPARKAKALHGHGVFHWLVGDLQLGKIDGDSTEGIVNRYLDSLAAGVREFKLQQKRHAISKIHLSFLGDCGEGNQSQGGNNMWRTHLTVTEQYRLFRRLELETIDAFLPYSLETDAVTVNGNHDRVQTQQATRMDDGHATEASIALADGLALNPARYGGVRIIVPSVDEGTITYDVAEGHGEPTVMTHAHGHQWPKGQQFRWWSEQALNLQSAGAGSFLLHGHTHEFDMKSKRDRTYICVPTFEAESTYWRQLHGDVARPGAVTMITRGTEWSDLSVV